MFVNKKTTVLMMIISALFIMSAMGAGSFPQPTICDRVCWSARAPQGTITQEPDLTRAVIHHTAGASDYDTSSLEESKSKVRAIQNYHMDNLGWSDVGYHFLTDKLGNNFEGRDGSMTSFPRGAHDAVNDSSFGFNQMGYYHDPYNQEPTYEGRHAMYDVIAWRMPDGYSAYGGGPYGPASNAGYLCGHRDVGSTACPGDLLYAYIGTDLFAGEARDEVELRITGGDPDPRPNPGPPTLRSVIGGTDSVTISWSDVGYIVNYNVYVSADGVNYASPISVDTGVTSFVDTGLTEGEMRYYKVTAVGTESESKDSDIYCVKNVTGAKILIVDGNDRWLTLDENPNADNHNFAAITAESVLGLAYDTADNNAVESGDVSLIGYDAVVWTLGEESTVDSTFTSTEQGCVTDYLNGGGNLFVSGAEIGWDLVEQGTSDDQAFYENYLKAEYKADDAAQYDAYAISGGIFDGVTGIDFSGGAMNIEYPDVIGPINGSVDEMYYTLGNNPRKTEYAAVSYSGTFKVVNMGFPFESINTIAVRADVMTRVVDFFALSGGDPTPTPTATPTPTPTDTPTATPTATSED